MATKNSAPAQAAQTPDTAIPPTDPGAIANPPAGFPIVGIGASAGGLAAFEAFFSGMPSDVDPGMAFVLVQHLSPDHKSMLTDLVRRYTRMQVFEVEDGMQVRINCAYIIPPNYNMAFLNGCLQLLEPSAPRGQRLPIDFFFRSLAQDQRERAVGIVLSGTGSDGTLGVRTIKDAGGIVIAQTPASAEFDGMPRSAIATGVVDFELTPAEMPAKLIHYAKYAFGRLPPLESAQTPEVVNAINKIYILLRAHTGHDFSGYKPGTIHRRIERRMAVHQVETLDGYVKYLQQTPSEVEALFRDLLIGVTNFFRDPEAFQTLEGQIIPKLFAGKPAGGVVRVWSTGCSTGEEAYSIAILLQERMELLKTSYTVQVFATDIDSRAIAVARAGVYPASIAADMTPERLARFFIAEPGGLAYRINKGIRDMLVFSEQDVLKDPPFSKLDLVSCRNLLIYFGPELQKKLIPLFHYALNPGGILFLGTSEGVSEFGDLFSVLDRKAKLYLRKEDFLGQRRAAMNRAVPMVPLLTGMGGGHGAHPVAIGRTTFATKVPLRELTEQALLQQLAVVGVLVSAQGDIFYLHGRSGMYLEPSPGEVGILNVLKMAREGLRPPLSTALHRCVASQNTVHTRNLRVKTNGHFTLVNLSVRPVLGQHPSALPPLADAPDAQLYLVTLEEAADQGPTTGMATQPDAAPAPAPDAKSPESQAEARIAELKEELRAKDEYLQSTHEELESSNEELKSSNEEMQSVNEELQSTNEELETSKEELQSVNEELATVNTELHTKVTDLSRVNNDMNNLLAGTGIATVFVDHNLRILRFTPTAAQIINLISSDIGRPVGHIVSNLVGYNQLVADVQTVLDTLAAKDAQVQTTAGAWFAMRIRPYRTLDNVIEGAVITFVDITDVKQAYTALEHSEKRYSGLVSALSEGIISIARDGKIETWNHAAETILGLSGKQLQARTVSDIRWQAVDEDGAPILNETFPALEVLRTGAVQSNVTMGLNKPDGTLAWILVNAVPIFNPGDPVPASVVVSFLDITERRKVEKKRRTPPAPTATSGTGDAP
jgi:two-component system CheB/CheR fusion protein